MVHQKLECVIKYTGARIEKPSLTIQPSLRRSHLRYAYPIFREGLKTIIQNLNFKLMVRIQGDNFEEISTYMDVKLVRFSILPEFLPALLDINVSKYHLVMLSVKNIENS